MHVSLLTVPRLQRICSDFQRLMWVRLEIEAAEDGNVAVFDVGCSNISHVQRCGTNYLE